MCPKEYMPQIYLHRYWETCTNAKTNDRLIKEIWAHSDRRIASINDLPIPESKRKYHWPLGRRPDDHPSLSDLGL